MSHAVCIGSFAFSCFLPISSTLCQRFFGFLGSSRFVCWIRVSERSDAVKWIEVSILSKVVLALGFRFLQPQTPCNVSGTGRLRHRSRGRTIAGAWCFFYYSMYVVSVYLFVKIDGVFFPPFFSSRRGILGRSWSWILAEKIYATVSYWIT